MTANCAPSGTCSPAEKRNSFTTPSEGEGISIVALSDSSVISDCSFVTASPGFTENCSISPSSVSVDEDGGSGSVSVSTGSGCSWTASSNDGWIAVTSGSSGSGSGSVGYRVNENKGKKARTGTVTIAGRTFTVSQGK